MEAVLSRWRLRRPFPFQTALRRYALVAQHYNDRAPAIAWQLTELVHLPHPPPPILAIQLNGKTYQASPPSLTAFDSLLGAAHVERLGGSGHDGGYRCCSEAVLFESLHRGDRRPSGAAHLVLQHP